MDEIITYDRLTASGPLEMALFQYRYPNGLTLAEMKAHEEGWIRRAAVRIEEEKRKHESS